MLRKINVKYIKLAYYFAIYDIIKQENINKNRELLAKQGGFRQVKKIDNSDKNTICVPRQYL